MLPSPCHYCGRVTRQPNLVSMSSKTTVIDCQHNASFRSFIKSLNKSRHCFWSRSIWEIIWDWMWMKILLITILMINRTTFLKRNCRFDLLLFVIKTACLKNLCLSSSNNTLIFPQWITPPNRPFFIQNPRARIASITKRTRRPDDHVTMLSRLPPGNRVVLMQDLIALSFS